MLRRVAAFLVVVLCSSGLRGQSIVTYAGGGTLDGAGNLIVVMRLSGQVLKIDAVTHVVTTLAGNGASGFAGDRGLAVNAVLRTPYAVVLDAAGNLFIADTNNGRVR